MRLVQITTGYWITMLVLLREVLRWKY